MSSFYAAATVNSKTVWLCRPIKCLQGSIISPGRVCVNSIRGRLAPELYLDCTLWDYVAPSLIPQFVTNGYGDDQFFKTITRKELEDRDRADIDEVRRTWDYNTNWNDLMPVCDHKWKVTQGIYREYKDCTKCNKKFEDVYPENK
jgi:hypothetical protein